MSEETSKAGSGYPPHEYADMFPMIKGSNLKELVLDIQAHGQRLPVILIGGKVLDGRNRQAACLQAGVACNYREFDPAIDGDSPLAFVISQNLTRRQLDDTQRAIVAAKLAKLKVGQKKKDGEALSQADVAALLNVKTIAVTRAVRVGNKAIKPIQVLLEEGTIPLSIANALATLPPAEQHDLVKQGVEAMRQRAGVILNPKKAGDQKAIDAQAKRMAEKDVKLKAKHDAAAKKVAAKQAKADAVKAKADAAKAKSDAATAKANAATAKAEAKQKKIADEAAAKKAPKNAQPRLPEMPPEPPQTPSPDQPSMVLRSAAIHQLDSVLRQEVLSDSLTSETCAAALKVLDRAIKVIANLPDFAA